MRFPSPSLRSLVPFLAIGSTALGQTVFEDRSQPVPQRVHTASDLKLVDLDGDSDLDLLVLGWLAPRSLELVLYENTSPRRFRIANVLPLGEVRFLEAADLDGDHRADLILLLQDRVHLIWNLGGFAFGAPVPFHPLPFDAVGVGDEDGDGDVDLLLSDGLRSMLFRNDGTGTFQRVRRPIPPSRTGDSQIRFVDLDGDHDRDILFSGVTEFQGTSWLSGTDVAFQLGNDTWRLGSSPYPIFPGAEGVTGLGIADVDGDSDLDLWLMRSHERYQLLNLGTGYFVNASERIPQTGEACLATLLADLDEDGDPDAWVSDLGGQRLLWNDGTGTFVDSGMPLPRDESVTNIQGGDLDGDGDRDVVTLSREGVITLWIQDERHAFQREFARLALPPGVSYDAAAGDVDGDGSADLLFARDSLTVLVNDGHGVYTPREQALPWTTGRTTLAVGDVDGDSALDVFFGDGLAFSGSEDHILRNDGTGRFFVQVGALPPQPFAVGDAAFADLDDDRDLDLVLACSSPFLPIGQNRILWNDGRGRFAELPGLLPQVAEETERVVVGDLDGDSDLDLLFANTWGSAVFHRFYENRGRHDFREHLRVLVSPSGVSISADVSVGDLDGDGRLDVVTAPVNDYPRWFRNEGGWRWSESVVRLPDPSLRSFARLSLDDFDGDSDLDILAVGDEGQATWWNDGRGRFTLGTRPLPQVPSGVRALVTLDADRDSDRDVVMASLSRGADRLWMNQWRQIDAASSPILGGTLALELTHHADTLWQLGFSRRSAHLATPFGILGLDLHDLHVAASGALRSFVPQTVSMSISSEPFLAGSELYWQVLFVQPIGLSNVLRTTFLRE